MKLSLHSASATSYLTRVLYVCGVLCLCARGCFAVVCAMPKTIFLGAF